MDGNRTRYVLALGEDARVVENTDGTALIERLPGVVLVEADVTLANGLAAGAEYVHVYSSFIDAHRAFSLFVPAS
jgi:hypothetical protein